MVSLIKRAKTDGKLVLFLSPSEFVKLLINDESSSGFFTVTQQYHTSSYHTFTNGGGTDQRSSASGKRQGARKLKPQIQEAPVIVQFLSEPLLAILGLVHLCFVMILLNWCSRAMLCHRKLDDNCLKFLKLFSPHSCATFVPVALHISHLVTELTPLCDILPSWKRHWDGRPFLQWVTCNKFSVGFFYLHISHFERFL